MNMKLSDNFTLREFTRSATAEALRIRNDQPSGTNVENMKALCRNVLEPLRAKLREFYRADAVVCVTSGYRCPQLNRSKEIGGAKNSQHEKGEAADLHVDGMTADQLFNFILVHKLPFDQMIQEFGQWVHISWKRAGRPNRGSTLYAWRNEKGATIFTKTPPPAARRAALPAPPPDGW